LNLGTLLRVLSRAWDLLLPHADFAYNKALKCTTGMSPFKVVHGIDPNGPWDIVPRPLDQRLSAKPNQRVEETKKMHEQVRDRIEKINATYSAQANKR